MREARATKYGRFYASFISYVLNSVPNSKEYREEFLRELRRYSLKPRKKRSCEK